MKPEEIKILRIAVHAINELKALVRCTEEDFEKHSEYQTGMDAEKKICQYFKDHK